MSSSWRRWIWCWRPGRWPPGGRTSGGRWPASGTWWPAKFKVQYTVPGIWYLLQRRGWTCQMGARRAIERDDGAVEVWKKETWPRIKARRRPSAAGSSSKTSAASR